MLSDVVTMRTTMAEDNFTAGQIVSSIWEVVLSGYIPCPAFPYQVCAAFVHAFLVTVFSASSGGKAGENGDGQLLPGYLLYNGKLSGLWLLLLGRLPADCLSTLVPPLKGFQFQPHRFFQPVSLGTQRCFAGRVPY